MDERDELMDSIETAYGQVGRKAIYPTRFPFQLPIRYPGGKRRAYPIIGGLFPATGEIVSPFAGGASLEIFTANDFNRDVEVVCYDKFDILVCYWKEQIAHPQRLYEKLKDWDCTQEKFDSVTKELKRHIEGAIRLPDDELAAHFWFNLYTSFGPKFLGSMSKVFQKQSRYQAGLDNVRGFRVQRLTYEQGDFHDTIPAHKDAFLYCDPPYLIGQELYPGQKEFDHEGLRGLLHEHRGNFVLSYNDCEAVRKMYSDFRISKVEWKYSYGQAYGQTKISNEILITKGEEETRIGRLRGIAGVWQ